MGIIQMRDIISSIARQKEQPLSSLVISLDEVEKVCSHVIILCNGKSLYLRSEWNDE